MLANKLKPLYILSICDIRIVKLILYMGAILYEIFCGGSI